MSQASQRIKSSQSSAEAKAKRKEAIRLALLEMNATESPAAPKVVERAGSDASNSDGLTTQTNALEEEIVPSSQPEITEDTPMDPGRPACQRFKVF